MAHCPRYHVGGESVKHSFSLHKDQDQINTYGKKKMGVFFIIQRRVKSWRMAIGI
jgi:hypothetical protein